MSRALLRKGVWTWLLAALASQAGACKSGSARAPNWSSPGGALGQRVRDGKVPSLSHLRFTSTILQREVAAVVATPPGYEERPEQRFPVVYIFSGIGADEWTYLREVTLDNPAVRTLYENPERAPILVFANPADSAGAAHALGVLGDELVREVDERFRTHKQRSARSVEGFSLGGVTALNLYLQRPNVFGPVVALSSACYLLPTCQALRADLMQAAQRTQRPRVLLAVGGSEIAKNRAVSDELAPLLGTVVEIIDGADHNWAALLQTPLQGVPYGQRIAEFHAQGFTSLLAR